MRIGIDISQTAYEGTGVARLVEHLVSSLLNKDEENEYVLFFSSMRKTVPATNYKMQGSKLEIKQYRFPPLFLDLIWNKLHIIPIEWLIGDVDVFISSDWTQPPTRKAKKATILYDLTVYKYPKETDKKIIDTQKRRLKWVKKECDAIMCISESTKNDAIEILSVPKERLHVVYPGVI
jgi:glycosyltransferase involved in cell wall biosynthesis